MRRVNTRKEGDIPLVHANLPLLESPSGRFQIDHAAVYDDYNHSTVKVLCTVSARETRCITSTIVRSEVTNIHCSLMFVLCSTPLAS
jgi:hypothetical protein